MRIQHALGVAGRARGVAKEGAEIFLDHRPGKLRALLVEQALITHRTDRPRIEPRLIRQHHIGPDGLEVRRDPLDHSEEIPVEQQHRTFSVIDRVDDLIIEQPRVRRVQHSANPRHGIEQLEMPVRVPGKARDPVAMLDAQPLQRVGRLSRPLQRVGIGVSPHRLVHEPCDDLAPCMRACREFQDIDDLQRRRLHQAGGHVRSPYFWPVFLARISGL